MRPSRLFVCKVCKHKITKHDKFCRQKGCICLLSIDQIFDLSAVEREIVRIKEEKKRRRVLRRQYIKKGFIVPAKKKKQRKRGGTSRKGRYS